MFLSLTSEVKNFSSLLIKIKDKSHIAARIKLFIL